MWQRLCPQCNRLLMKEHLKQIIKCLCGWTWGDSRSLERRAQKRQKPTKIIVDVDE